MKKVHIHISVEDLNKSISFYTAQLDTKPTKVEKDYAQWLLDDPAINFAISTRGYAKGVNHLGILYESDETLLQAQERFESASLGGRVERDATCCYKRSNKYWLKDPNGIIWENYHSMEDIELFGKDAKDQEAEDVCCSGINTTCTT